MPRCISCGNDVQVSVAFQNFDIMPCPLCGKKTPTGQEVNFRVQMEPRVRRPFPKVTAARAVSYSKRIYDVANKPGKTFKTNVVEQQIANSPDPQKAARAGQVIASVPIIGRGYQGLIDNTLVCQLLVVEDGQQDHTIYVVFRGSVGIKQETGAGRDTQSPRKNVDWRANFDNQMAPADYAPGSGILIHAGFKEILGSYKVNVEYELNAMRTEYPQAKIVISGHSQGAAHALLFAHELVYLDPDARPFVLPFSAPRVGNLLFARDFNTRISDRASALHGDGHWDTSCLILVQENDKVPVGQTNAFKNPNKKSIVAPWRSRRNLYADQQLIIGKGLYALNKNAMFGDPTQIFYHPKHLVIAAKSGMHAPDKFRASITKRLGRDGY